VRKFESPEEMLKRAKEKLAAENVGRRDPDQFIPPKAKDKEKIEYYIRILPPLEEGDVCSTGKAKTSSVLWYHNNGNHWIMNERLECPRTHDGEKCPLCDIGFEMLRENDDEDARARIRQTYLSRTGYAVNAYFLNTSANPENVRGKVLWINLPKTCYDRMIECMENDNPGTAEEPRPTGAFWHPLDGYTFKIVVEKKGKQNTYEQSQFLPNSRGPMVKKKDQTADEAKIEEILDRRHYLPGKFAARNLAKINAVVSKLGSKYGTPEADDADEKIEVRKPAAVKKAVTVATTDVAVEGVVKGGLRKKQEAPPAEEETPEEVTEEAPKPPVKTAAAATKTAAVATKAAPAKAAAEEVAEEEDPELKNLLDEMSE